MQYAPRTGSKKRTQSTNQSNWRQCLSCCARCSFWQSCTYSQVNILGVGVGHPQAFHLSASQRNLCDFALTVDNNQPSWCLPGQRKLRSQSDRQKLTRSKHMFWQVAQLWVFIFQRCRFWGRVKSNCLDDILLGTEDMSASFYLQRHQ